MKVKVYLRVAHGARGPRVAAATQPNYEALLSGSGYNAKPLPTAAFAIELTIPEPVFERASQVLAVVKVSEQDVQVAADVKPPIAEVES